MRDSTTLFFSFRLLIVVAAQCLPFDARGIGAKIGSENMTAGIAIGTGEYGYERDRDDDHYSRGTYDRNRDPNRDYDGGQVEESRSRPRLWKEEGLAIGMTEMATSLAISPSNSGCSRPHPPPAVPAAAKLPPAAPNQRTHRHRT